EARRSGLGALPPRPANPTDLAEVPDQVRATMARHRRAVDGWRGRGVLRGAAAGVLRLGRLVLRRAEHPAAGVAERVRHPGGEAPGRLRRSRRAELLLAGTQPGGARGEPSPHAGI